MDDDEREDRMLAAHAYAPGDGDPQISEFEKMLSASIDRLEKQ